MENLNNWPADPTLFVYMITGLSAILLVLVVKMFLAQVKADRKFNEIIKRKSRIF